MHSAHPIQTLRHRPNPVGPEPPDPTQRGHRGHYLQAPLRRVAQRGSEERLRGQVDDAGPFADALGTGLRGLDGGRAQDGYGRFDYVGGHAGATISAGPMPL